MTKPILLVAIPVCRKDYHLALRNLELCQHFESKVRHHAVVCAEAGLDVSELLKQCNAYFAKTHHLTYTDYQGETRWPVPQNYAWQQSARQIERLINSTMTECTSEGLTRVGCVGWLWWEADATPLKPGWLDTLCKTRYDADVPALTGFAGVVIESDVTYMNGVGIWPCDVTRALQDVSSLYTRTNAFDKAAANVTCKAYRLNHLIVHHMKVQGGGEGKSFDAASARKMLGDNPEVVLFHGCTDGSLADFLQGRKGTLKSVASAQVTRTFYHSGDLGDIIYALPAIKAFSGGAVIYLGPSETGTRKCREPINKKRFDNIASLLKAQSYIKDVIYAPERVDVDFDLNHFRETLFKDFDPGRHIAHIVLRHLGMDPALADKPWLDAPFIPNSPEVIIARSSRYHAPGFPWKDVLRKYKGRVAFIGTPDEHIAFTTAYGEVPYKETKTLLDVARVIKSSRLFIGNQSCPYAIAEGLKHDTVQETSPNVPNCVYPRKNALHFDASKPFALPEVFNRKSSAKTFVLRAPIDGFTGYGQSVSAIATGLMNRGYDVQLVPTRVDKNMAPVDPRVLRAIVEDKPSHMLFHTHDAFPALLRPREAVFTMWESTRIAPEAVTALNERASRCAVPTVWNACCFDAAGVNTPISIVPLGIDTVHFKYRPPAKDKTVVFGAAGRFAHGGCRKGLEEVVEAFLAAFPKEKNVRLELKIFNDCAIKQVNDPRVIYHRKFMPWTEFVRWYAGLTAFVSASKAEGWGLHHLQAMAIGRPLVACHFGGVADFFDPSLGYPIDYKLAPCNGVYQGMGLWAEPDLKHLAEIMRQIARKPKEALDRGYAASKKAAQYSWENCLDKLEPVIKELIS